MSECGLSVWYRASVGLVGQAVDDIAKGSQVGIEEEWVMAWQSQVALHQSLWATQVHKVQPGVQVSQLALCVYVPLMLLLHISSYF